MHYPIEKPHVGAALAIMLGASSACALVNPNFTPLHLERQSRLIGAARVVAVATNGASAEIEIFETIKGEAAGRRLSIVFAAPTATPEELEKVADAVAAFRKAGSKPIFLALGGEAGEPDGALLHVADAWLRLSAREAGSLAFQGFDARMNGTFNGGTDMLLNTMRFMRDFPDVPVMPAGPGMTWTTHEKIAAADGRATAAIAVDANDDGRPDLFVASPRGDKLIISEAPDRWTECAGLASASAAAAWADYDGDGRPDLASLSAAGLTLYFQTAPGKFAPRAVPLPLAPHAGALTIDVIDRGDGRASLVLGAGRPVVLKNSDGKGAFAAAPLPLPEPDLLADYGLAGPCVAGDLDGDGLADVLQIHERDGIFWRGRPDGAFEPLPGCGALMGKVRERRLLTADLDGDGLSDVLLVGGGATPLLLHNRGGGRFEETMRQTGEPGYIVQSGAACAALGDFNGDMFVDLFAGYGEEDGQFFFNRGFRSFAIAEALKFREDDMAGCGNGQAAACWLDVDGDGALELITVLSAGDVYLSRSSVGEVDEPRRIVAKVPKVAGYAGPLVVKFSLQGRCLGSRLADRWRGQAVMAVPVPGRYTVSWRSPDGRERAKTIDIERARTEIVLE